MASLGALGMVGRVSMGNTKHWNILNIKAIKGHHGLRENLKPAHEGTIYAYAKAILAKLSKLSFCQKILFEPNSFIHMFKVSSL